MKQLVIGNGTYSAKTNYNEVGSLAEGVIGLYNLTTGKLITSSADLVNNFAVVTGRKEGLVPRHFSEVDVKSLTVQKAEYSAGSTFKATFTVQTVEKGSICTINITKTGKGFNERNNWSYSVKATSTDPQAIASSLADEINKNGKSYGVTATVSSAIITISGIKEGDNYVISGADALLGISATVTVAGKKAILDTAYIKDLASRCAAGKGFNYLGEGGEDLYPGYPEDINSDEYVLYTLRFAVPRVASKQRDEVVYQLLHIAIPTDGAAIDTLDSIFGISEEESDEDDTE